MKKVKVLVTQSCPTAYDLMDCSLPGSSTRRENRGRLPSPWDLPDPEIEPGSAALQADSYHLSTIEAPNIGIPRRYCRFSSRL